tara:strand:+ start:1584 stop:1733 length:150 start_codon:yes stop_codon:yes gene_type:complete
MMMELDEERDVGFIFDNETKKRMLGRFHGKIAKFREGDCVSTPQVVLLK